jgi:hypothetical protein
MPGEEVSQKSFSQKETIRKKKFAGVPYVVSSLYANCFQKDRPEEIDMV